MADQFFNPPSDRLLTAHDLWGKKHSAPTSQFKLRASVYGILVKQDQILLQRSPLTKKFSLPGGAIEIGETIDQALVREFREETGLTVKPTKLVDVCQDFFTHDGKFAHSILIFYGVNRLSGRLSPGHEDSVETIFLPLQSLNLKAIQPIFRPIISPLQRRL